MFTTARNARAATTPHGQRPRKGQDEQRQQRLHRPAHAYSHRARRPQAEQNRDSTPGVKLHLPPRKCITPRRHLWRRPAVSHQQSLLPASPNHYQPQTQGHRARPTQADLHLLPQQPKEAGKGQREEDGDQNLMTALGDPTDTPRPQPEGMTTRSQKKNSGQSQGRDHRSSKSGRRLNRKHIS